MRFFLDHDVPDRVAGVLSQAGHEVVRLREELSTRSDDETVLEHARVRGMVLVTCNRDDFLELARRRGHGGIIILIRRRTRLAECSALLRLIGQAGPQGIESNVNYA